MNLRTKSGLSVLSMTSVRPNCRRKWGVDLRARLVGQERALGSEPLNPGPGSNGSHAFWSPFPVPSHGESASI